jgi:spermidine synthase
MFLEKIYQLKADESQTLYSEEIENQTIEVREWQQYRWLQIGGDSVQTLMDLKSIDQVSLPNIQALLSALIFCPSAKRLLNLGLGGASIERYLDSKHSEIEISSVEPYEQVIKLAKDYFFLPEGVDVIHDTAENYLKDHNDVYDIILCDIFSEEAQPSCLYSDDFYSNIYNRLDKSGVLAINLLPDSEEDVVSILLPMKNYFNHISLLEVPNHLNVIIFASNQKFSDIDTLIDRANHLYEKTMLDLKDVPENLNRLLETV